MTAAPFRRCDYKNLGVSYLCSLTDQTLPQPKIWGKQVRQEYKTKFGFDDDQLPDYITREQDSERQHMPKVSYYYIA